MITTMLTTWSQCTLAHVKWFAEYDLTQAPRSFFQIVFDDVFIVFCALLAPTIFAIAWLDRYLVQRKLFTAGTLMHLDLSSPFVSIAIRVGVCLFFAGAAVYGFVSGDQFILTPELKTNSSAVLVTQIFIAFVVLFTQAAFLAGIGIMALYVYALSQFGFYHLLDYPIFIGVAIYLVIDSLFGEQHASASLCTLRLCTGFTLLWASIEKFAYPQWSFVLLDERPEVAFGFSPEFYMIAAGFVEFCAAYLIITGNLSSRAASVLLLFFFVSAIYYFGVLDAIGHAVIVIVLVVLALSSNPIAARLDSRNLLTTAGAHTLMFFLTLSLFIVLYCAGHALLLQR